ncbi:MAG: hypothetical protein K6G45_13035 [Lachnospiraceae bacterium]|nr:hypothetical protein [Lachnospiraceae bacterium]
MCYYEKKEVATWQSEVDRNSNNTILLPCLLKLLHKAQTEYINIIGFMESPKDDFTRRVYQMRLADQMNWTQIEIAVGVDSHTLRNAFCRDKAKYEKQHGIVLNTNVI